MDKKAGALFLKNTQNHTFVRNFRKGIYMGMDLLIKASALFILSVLLTCTPIVTTAQDHSQEEQHESHAEDGHQSDDICGSMHHDDHGGEFQPAETAFHHISDLNVYSIGPWNFPLPCILFVPGEGFEFFSSSKFDFKTRGHGDGTKAYNGWVLDGGMIRRVVEDGFPDGNVEIGGVAHVGEEEMYVCYQDTPYKLDAKSTMLGSLFGGGQTSFYDFSITKNVVSMFLVSIFLLWLFFRIAKAYRDRDGQAPKGIQSFMEPIFVFIQDEVAKPFLGEKWEKYLPFLMSLFFFILALNLFGQIPFFGGSNVTGNLAVTMALAILAFIVTNISGKKHYWEHVFWMPGIPAAIKAIIITPVEFMGLFIKPFTLMLRLFANITAGHMVVLSFIGLIFIFGKTGDSLGGSILGAGLSVPLTLFMMAIELLVAFSQAFVFTILTASYIGAAIEEHH